MIKVKYLRTFHALAVYSGYKINESNNEYIALHLDSRKMLNISTGKWNNVSAHILLYYDMTFVEAGALSIYDYEILQAGKFTKRVIKHVAN